MNTAERLELDRLVKENGVTDSTQEIRNRKHSRPLKDSVDNMIKFKKEERLLLEKDPDAFDALLVRECSFMFNYYTDLYNRLKKDELDIDILYQFIDILRDIEEGDIDQHDGAYKVGKLLKQIYIDSALKRSNKMDSADKDDKTSSTPSIASNICWKEYKNLNRFV